MPNNTMTNQDKPAFTQEWAVLHADHEKYERYSLLIKLFSVLICFFSLVSALSVVISIILIAVIWLQDGIWKTFQSRMSDRILLIERYIKEQAAGDSEEVAFQFYTDWERSPKTTVGLVKEYIKNSFRPTVAYPYAVLILLQVAVFTLTK